jgi:hypothetical protein
MSDKDTLKKTLKKTLSEVAKTTKAKGFSKKGATFLRKHGKTEQVINFQMNSAGVGFYLNVGLIFDELGLMDGAMGEYFGGALVQYSFRVKDGIAGTWTPGADASLLAQRIVTALTQPSRGSRRWILRRLCFVLSHSTMASRSSFGLN